MLFRNRAEYGAQEQLGTTLYLRSIKDQLTLLWFFSFLTHMSIVRRKGAWPTSDITHPPHSTLCPRSFRGITNKRELEDEVTIISKTLCSPHQKLQQNYLLLFSLSSFLSIQEAERFSPQRTMAHCFFSPRFKFQQIISKFIFITRILYWVFSNGQEICRKYHTMIHIDRHVSFFFFMEYYLAIRQEQYLPFTRTWIELECILLREISQWVRDNYHMVY